MCYVEVTQLLKCWNDLNKAILEAEVVKSKDIDLSIVLEQ